MTTSPGSVVLCAIDQAFVSYLPARLDTPEARQIMMAISKQESGWKHFDQLESRGGRDLVPGPALGPWQFELGGGTKGVMEHRASRDFAREAVARARIPWNRREVWLALEYNLPLAATFARLLLWTDPRPLPAIGEVQASWDYYLRNWKPGKPHPDEWPGNYRDAKQLIKGES